MSKIYEIVLYTSRRKPYIKQMLEKIDSKRRISHVLLRDHCIIINKAYNLKHIRILGRDEQNVIFVDVHIPITKALTNYRFTST